MLSKLLPEEKEFFDKLIARRHGVRESIDIFYSEYPDAQEYKEQSFYAYVKSDEGKERIHAETAVLREEAGSHSFAHRGSRVAALVEISERLLSRIRGFPTPQVGSQDYVRVSGEFRRSLQDIKAEVDILGLGDGDAMDIFAAFTSLVKSDESLPSFLQKSLDKGQPVLITDPSSDEN